MRIVPLPEINHHIDQQYRELGKSSLLTVELEHVDAACTRVGYTATLSTPGGVSEIFMGAVPAGTERAEGIAELVLAKIVFDRIKDRGRF